MKSVGQEHAAADRFIAKSFADNPLMKPCCRAGCFACCYEPLFVSNAEVEHILESLTPEQIAEVKAKLPAWLETIRSIMQQKDIHAFNYAMNYRRLNAACVFLKNGLCSVYPRRPFGCRTFFALKNPENCQLPAREHQLFARFTDDLFRATGRPTTLNGKLILDHLGILLAERLLGINCPSAARTVDTEDQLSGMFPPP